MPRFQTFAVLAALASGLLNLTAFAQPDLPFGDGKPYVFTETELDRRFLKTGIYQALMGGSTNAACSAVLGGLLTALAETGPAMHQYDDNFYLEPELVFALDNQMTLPRFSAKAFLATMYRRVRIDQKMPDQWLARAEQIKHPTIDLAKLRYLADRIRPVQSFYLTVPKLRAIYEKDVTLANSSATEMALTAFRDTYLDREVAWSGLTLLDIGVRKGSKGEPDAMVAQLEYSDLPRDAPQNPLDLIEKPKTLPPVIISARLESRQYVPLAKLPKNSQVWVRGRLFDIGKGFAHVELRDALIFEDRTWNGVALVPPGAVARCPITRNDLTGTSARQPGGFGQH